MRRQLFSFFVFSAALMVSPLAFAQQEIARSFLRAVTSYHQVEPKLGPLRSSASCSAIPRAPLSEPRACQASLRR